MILCIGSSLTTFKSIRFQRGLNIVLAERTASSTERQTRNSAGKSSVVEIIQFLLGSDAPKDSPFRTPELTHHRFWIVLRLSGRLIRVTRIGATPSRIYLNQHSARRLGIPTQSDEDSSDTFASLDDWRTFLGTVWFGLPWSREGTAFDVKRAPTFRMLIGYFARRSRDVGFAHFARYSERQSEADAKVALSYLLGLDWTIPHKMRADADRHRKLLELRKVISEGELGDVVSTSAAIRPELARAEVKANEIEAQLGRFRVHDQYLQLTEEAARLQDETADMTLSLAKVRNTIAYLTRTADEETPPGYASIETIYAAIGIELPEIARRKFEDVAAFQASVVENRRAFLNEQIADARREEADLEDGMANASERRDVILAELRGKGAFDDFVQLQGEMMEARARRDMWQEKLKAALALEISTTERKRQSAEDELRLQRDYEVHEDNIRRATRLVDQAIRNLYDDRHGNLVISPTKNGPLFSLAISGSGNQGGIDQMKIFCFDIMLFQILGEHFGGPRFLIHDSHLFDGVDPRQTRSALLLGKKVADMLKSQYIVLLNSDNFDKLSGHYDIDSAVNSLRLTDTEDGGLFGIRFDLPSQRR